MLVVSGTVLVLLTWLVAVAMVVSVGLLPALALSPSNASRRPIIRRALWWGLLVMTIGVLLIHQFVPLHSAAAALLIACLVAVLAVPGWWLLLRRSRRAAAAPGRWTRRLLSASLLLVIVYLAVAALGPVTNYDTGLYHLGAIRYAAEFPAIPGLANLYYPLGYATGQFPLAAIMGNGPWQNEGMRLINGLVLVLALADLWLRSRTSRPGPGFYVLVAGIVASSIPLVGLTDYWVTSPTQDASVLVLTAVLSAYFAQALVGGRGWAADAATGGALAIMIVLLRPTMIVYAVAVMMVLGYLMWRRRALRVGLAPMVVTGTAAVAALIAVTLRDRVLSGWVQFPLSIYGFDVPWRTPDPVWNRAATLGFHRNSADLWGSVEGWAWIRPWVSDRAVQWETYELAALLVVALGLCVVAVHRVGPAFRLRALAALLAPSIAGVIFWFVFTPPAYRFAWGILFSLGVIPIGWSLWRLSATTSMRWVTVTFAVATLSLMAITALSAAHRMDLASMTAERDWRLGPMSLRYVVTPIADANVEAFMTDSGLILMQPTESDQCWTAYPLCTPQPSPLLRLAGSGLESGFLP